MSHERLIQRAQEARLWWLGLQGSQLVSQRAFPPNNQALAELRRATTPIQALMVPAGLGLLQRIAGKKMSEKIRVLELATLLAHIRKDQPSHKFASRLGGNIPENRIMQPARFHKLMLSDSEERATSFRRAIHMLKGSANVLDIAYGWLGWDDQYFGEEIRIEWMLRYAGARQIELEPYYTDKSTSTAQLPKD